MFNIGDVVKIKDEFETKYSRFLEKADSNKFKINAISRWKDGTVVLMFEGFDHFAVYADAVSPIKPEIKFIIQCDYYLHFVDDEEILFREILALMKLYNINSVCVYNLNTRERFLFQRSGGFKDYFYEYTKCGNF